jgi:hypothetical protein
MVRPAHLLSPVLFARWAFVAVSDTLADTFEKQYSIGSHSASASIAASLESLAMGASASVSASASASTSISASATAAASTAITTAAEEEDEQTAATTGLSAQLLISLCNMHNRLAVQLLQGCSDKSVESITLSSHLPLLRTLVPALAAAAHGQASAAGSADTGAWQAASKDAAAILQARDVQSRQVEAPCGECQCLNETPSGFVGVF